VLELVQTDVVGLISVVLATYERMKMRREGKIVSTFFIRFNLIDICVQCIVGSTTGCFAPANMIAYASSKAFLNTFSASLRALACCCASPNNINMNLQNAKTNATSDGIEVTTVLSGYIDLCLADGSRDKSVRYRSGDRAARKVVRAVERGGEAVCVPGTMEGLLIYALKGAVSFHNYTMNITSDECLPGVNPVCDDAARFLSWKLGAAARNYVASD
jgi:NAD(P)-dependent dehydrogenase (short-subunit alcohol dehydrogenase family)